MKNKIIIIIAIIISIGLFSFVKALNTSNRRGQFSLLNRFQQKDIVIVGSHGDWISEALLDVKKVEEFKGDYNSYLSSEIMSTLAQKELEMHENDLIGKANKGQLTKKSSRKLVELIRQKQALNMILLDDKMKKFEGKYL
jgi:hypothetical protein